MSRLNEMDIFILLNLKELRLFVHQNSGQIGQKISSFVLLDSGNSRGITSLTPKNP